MGILSANEKVIFPSGRTSWGFDWHGPSKMNIDASIEALRSFPGVPEDLIPKLKPATERLVLVGHSSGGHGAWWYLVMVPLI